MGMIGKGWELGLSYNYNRLLSVSPLPTARQCDSLLSRAGGPEQVL